MFVFTLCYAISMRCMRTALIKFATRAKQHVVLIFTIEQILEYDGGFMDFSWYNILHMMMTHVHTVQTLEARGRYWL